MFAKQIENQGVNKVEMDWKGSLEDFKNGYGYMEMANINQDMANSGIHSENEAEELLISFYTK